VGKTVLSSYVQSMASGEEYPVTGTIDGNTTESRSQFTVPESMTFSNLWRAIESGGSGTNTLRLRKNAANGNQVLSSAGAGERHDAVNTDACVSSDLVNLGHSDTGTNPFNTRLAMNVEFASGHGAIHVTAIPDGGTFSTASSTAYLYISGNMSAGGDSTESNTQLKNRAYTSIESLQVRVVTNGRSTNCTLTNRINGADGTGAVSITASFTGVFTDFSIGDSLADGDLINYALTLGTGTGSLTVTAVSATYKSTNNKSDVISQGSGATLSSSGSVVYRYPGGNLTLSSGTVANYELPPRVDATCSNLRFLFTSNSFTGAATFGLAVNGTDQITATAGAGLTGWFENTSDTWDISPSDRISFSFTGGTANTALLRVVAITLEEITAPTDDGDFAITPSLSVAFAGSSTAAGVLAAAPALTSSLAGSSNAAAVFAIAAINTPAFAGNGVSSAVLAVINALLVEAEGEAISEAAFSIALTAAEAFEGDGIVFASGAFSIEATVALGFTGEEFHAQCFHEEVVMTKTWIQEAPASIAFSPETPITSAYTKETPKVC
jgi:hypothetical protein